MGKKSLPPKSKPVKKLAEKPVVQSQEVTALLVHPPNLPLRPYLDDIWDVLTGFDGDIGDIDTDLTLKANIASPTFTGTVVLPSTTSVGTVSSAEIAFIGGLTSNAQTQIDGKNATLVSGVNLKTVNGNTLLGAGDLVIAGGGGDMVLADVQTVTGAKTFEDGKLLLRNVGNTFNGVFTNTNLADRVYTLKDANGTLAFTSDITGTNSGTNTGDQTSIVGITGSLAEFNTALTGADFATGGGTASGTNTGDNAVNTLYSGLVSNATHSGDATGDTALTVVGINGTLLSGLATGILKNTTTTGVPSIAVAGDFPTLNQNTSGTANIDGGSLGAIPYQSGANTTTVLAATATADKVLMSGSSAAPVWSTPTFPNASATANKVIKSDGTNWVASTETLAAPGTTGNLLKSDGTNWTSSAVKYHVPYNGFNGPPSTSFSPADASTYYLGMFSFGTSYDGMATSIQNHFIISKAGTIKSASVYLYSGTTGTAEDISAYIRHNNTTDTLIQTLGAATALRTFSNAGLSIAVAAGDYVVLKFVFPTWATNPATCRVAWTFDVEYSVF